MVSTRKKNYGEPPPPWKHLLPKGARKDEPKENPVDKQVSTRKKNYGEPPPPWMHLLPKGARKDEPKENPVDKQVPCLKFVLFPRLPCELRLMIWEASMAPQLLVVRPRKVRPCRSPDSRKIIPAQLSVNMESRHSALRRYSLRFTMTLNVDVIGNHRGDGALSLHGKTFDAKVVMSPDDTLGLQDWEDLHLGPKYWFEVKNANLVNCFGLQIIQPCGTQPEVKNVAYLAPDFGMIHDLNPSLSWDVNSWLYACGNPSQRIDYRSQAPGGFWRVGRRAPGGPNTGPLCIHSCNFNGTLQEWGRRLLHRVRHKGRCCRLAPHIMAFQLGKKQKAFTRPTEPGPNHSQAPIYEMHWLDRYHSCLQDF